MSVKDLKPARGSPRSEASRTLWLRFKSCSAHHFATSGHEEQMMSAKDLNHANASDSERLYRVQILQCPSIFERLNLQDGSGMDRCQPRFHVL